MANIPKIRTRSAACTFKPNYRAPPPPEKTNESTIYSDDSDDSDDEKSRTASLRINFHFKMFKRLYDILKKVWQSYSKNGMDICIAKEH